MALQLGALRDALLEANVSPEKANRAAEEVAAYDNRLHTIDAKLATLIESVGSLKTLMTYSMGITLTVLVTLIGLIAGVWWKLSDLAMQVANLTH